MRKSCILKNIGYSIRSDEEVLKSKLEGISLELKKSGIW